MKWQKAPEELKAVLDAAMQDVECERRVMFGYPAYFVNRNMFIGLYQDQLFMRLPASVVSSLKAPGAPVRNLEPMPGRPMKDYFVIPRNLYLDQARLKTLMRAALEHARSLKPKPPRKAPTKTIRKPSVRKESGPKPGKG